ncbi:MAG: hypothetical protein J6Y02_22160 [Pseudobutyrivibrio sp.]|nr:hypothetical protein [Pseudobutyrivibrio sp.]
MMKISYEKANDQHIAQITLFGKAADGKLYYDLTADDPEQVTEEDLQKAFATGKLVISVTVSETETIYTPVAVVGNKAKTVDVASETVTVTEWAAKASA